MIWSGRASTWRTSISPDRKAWTWPGSTRPTCGKPPISSTQPRPGGCSAVPAASSSAWWPPEWEVAVFVALLGGVVGAWSASMVGISIPSPRLQRFEGAIAQGQILLMVDLPRSRVRDIEALLQSAHPEARFEGDEPQVPALL